MIVLMAGLPGSGKTTLAQALAAQTNGVVLNKDVIRSALFAPDEIEYSTGQDDFCQKVMLEAASYILGKEPGRMVFLDGRPFSRRYQIEQVMKLASELKQQCRIIECVCSDATARQRLEQQAAQGEHPAANRDFGLYLRVKESFEPISAPATVIDTEQPLEVCATQALAVMRRR